MAATPISIQMIYLV